MTNEISSFYKTNQFVYIRLYMYKYKNNYFRDHTFDLLRKKPANKSLISLPLRSASTSITQNRRIKDLTYKTSWYRNINFVEYQDVKLGYKDMYMTFVITCICSCNDCKK